MKISIATVLALAGVSVAQGPPLAAGGRFAPRGTLENETITGPPAPSTTSTTTTPALRIYDNTPGLAYLARIKGKINARVLAYSDPSGWGTIFHLNVDWLDPNSGPFSYHIHDKPVNGSGDCMSAGGHLDPYGRGTKPACDTSRLDTCEAGDLSGKYGALTLSNNEKNFVDVFTSTVPGHAAFFGNRSIVIHDKDNNRIACTNFYRTRMPAFSEDYK